MAASKQSISNRNTGKILLVGDIRKVFLDAASAASINCEVHATLPEAVKAVQNSTFSAIAVVLSGIQTKLNSSIKSLRDKCGARIVLLAQMYEEPIAIRLTCSVYNDKPLADDYMICPVQVDNFCEFLTSGKNLHAPSEYQRSEESASWAALSDESTETKIRHLEKMATEDDLTGLKNRRYIREFARQIIEYARKENGRVTLLVFDIDNFKKYNDLYGHTAGDEILKQAAHLMHRCCRAHDVVGRIGGDEFAVVFWDDPSILKAVIEQSKNNDRRSIDSDHPHEAMLIARRFISELEKTPAPVGTRDETGLGPEGTGVLTISGGLASYPRDGQTIQELFEQADKALLEAKRSGKNRIYLVGKPVNQ
ncbi:MAG: GGDEF domain-containing protein [Sedimentisphaerales bacterium]|nr:GGDEF domain-containing protein [Sedimentisphaerales bacterium]